MNMYDVVVIGGGAAGMMAAIYASYNGAKVAIIEHNEKLGKKLYITGKGKCNLTNNSSVETHLNNIVTNSKFMFSALNNFSAQDTIEFFENNGLKTRTERGNRVFPESDKSSDVIKTLVNCINNNNVKVTLNTEIERVYRDKDTFNILCKSGIIYTCKCLIIATGGLSYSGTGATGMGYELAKQFGHNVVEPKPALCSIVVKEDISNLNGLSLRNVELSTKIGNKNHNQFGDLLFTYNSLTGPIALTLSSLINKFNLHGVKLYIDFKPALTETHLEEKFKREFVVNAKKDLKNYLHSLLPAKIIDYFMQKIKLPNKKLADINKEERNSLILGLKKFDFSIKSLDNINVGIVTSGGVDVKEIEPKTCQSKLVKNLFFAGEVLDVDALTGGFNLQVAWSTGVLAGTNAALIAKNIN